VRLSTNVLGANLERGGSTPPMRFHLLENHPALLSLLVIVLAIATPLALLSPYFQTNDDAAFMLLVSGQVLSTEPSELIYWFHPFLSYALAWLYRQNGNVPWYGLMHLGSLVLALWAILYAVLLKGCSWQRVGLCLLCVVSLGLPFAISLQFTKTAFLAGIAGIVLLATTIQQCSSSRTSWRRLFPQLGSGILLLVLSFLIRDRSLMLAVVVSLPVLGFLTWSAWRRHTLRFFVVILVGISLILSALGYVYSYVYAQSFAWERFHRLNPLKSEFLDYGHIPYNAESQLYFREMGWSENDYQCFLNWWYVDPILYSPEKLQAIATHFSASARSSADIHSALLVLATNVQTDGMTWVVVPLCCGIAMLGLRRLSSVLILLATVVGVGVTLIVLAVFLKLPVYLLHATLTAPCWFALWLSEESQITDVSLRQPLLLRVGGMLLISGVLLILLHDNSLLMKTIEQSRKIEQNNSALRHAMNRLAPRISDTFVAWGGNFPYEMILPLERHDYLRNFRMIAVAALNQSPVQQRMLDDQGIKDLPRVLFERDNVFLSLNVKKRGTLLTRYLAEHYGVAVTLTLVVDDPPLQFWRVSPL
jgi:hypothetical protein